MPPDPRLRMHHAAFLFYAFNLPVKVYRTTLTGFHDFQSCFAFIGLLHFVTQFSLRSQAYRKSVAFGAYMALARCDWSVRFHRAGDGYRLIGVSSEGRCKRFITRLKQLKARKVRFGQAQATGLWWVEFEGSLALAGRLALVFPCEGYEPLLVDMRSGRLLQGIAEVRGREQQPNWVKFQVEVGRRAWA